VPTIFNCGACSLSFYSGSLVSKSEPPTFTAIEFALVKMYGLV